MSGLLIWFRLNPLEPRDVFSSIDGALPSGPLCFLYPCYDVLNHMVYINEWLPNPTGSDATGEWVELFNGGSAPMNLGGWVLKTATGKTKLSGTIGADQYLVFARADTKLVLKNADEKLFLYDAGGKLVDQSSFLGSAPDGKSFSRIGYGSSAGGQPFAWSDPSPGAANIISLDTGIMKNNYPAGQLNKNLGAPEFFLLLFGSAIMIAAFVVFALQQHGNLSKLFFGRDEEIWL